MNLIPRHSLFDLDSLFDHFWAPVKPGTERAHGAFMPRVDVKDRKEHIEITAELPGVNRDDIQVTLENGILTLSAESHQEDKEEKEGKVIRQERRYGRYQRSFEVGKGVKEDDIQASFEDGILKITAPKVTAEAPVQRRIEIR